MTVKITGNSSASTPSFAGDDGDSGLHATADQVQLVTNGTVGVTVDSSQNVGIGETSPDEPLHITASDPAIKLQDSDGTDQYSIIKNAGGDSIYDAVNGTGVGGDHIFRAPTGSANEHVRITSSGNVGIGTNAPTYNLDVQSSGDTVIRARSSTTANPSFILSEDNNTKWKFESVNNSDNRLRIINQSSADVVTVEQSGEVYINNNVQDAAVGSSCKLQVRCTAAEHTAVFRNTHSTPHGVLIVYNTDKNNTGSNFLRCNGSSTIRAEIRSNGGLANYQSNNLNFSDEREKKNIEPVDSTWGCLKNWDLKKFHYNEDADTDDKRYGVIAQQVAEHCPEVITEWVKQSASDAVLDDDGNVVTPAVEEVTRLGVKEQQMMWMAIKALQEAQARIETLETVNAEQATTIASFEARISALEGGN